MKKGILKSLTFCFMPEHEKQSDLANLYKDQILLFVEDEAPSRI
jgi:hypothetical protein